MITIYAIINSVNEKIYIGQTVQELNFYWRTQLSYVRREKDNKPKLYRAIRKYGANCFTMIPLLIVDTKADADYYEILLIAGFRCIENGYNVVQGGGGTVGYRHTEDAKNKCRLAAKKRIHIPGAKRQPLTDEQKLQRSEAGKLRTHSLRTRLKMSQSQKGRIISKEHREKISQARKLWWDTKRMSNL